MKSGLLELQQDFKKCGADIRWVKPQGIHLTLKFLGEIEERKSESIIHVMKGACDRHRAFTLEISGAGVFPDIRSPRVLWAGIEHNEDLSGLQSDIESGLASLGFEKEKRKFRPHLTLGRFKSSKGKAALTDILEKKKDIKIGSVNVGALYLMRSDLGPAGAKYTRIAEVPLGNT